MPRQDSEARFIGEAHDLGQESIAIATTEVESLRVSVGPRGARLDLRDISDKLEFEIFAPSDVIESGKLNHLEDDITLTRCASIPTRIIARNRRVYIRRGALNDDRSAIIETARTHMCFHEEDRPALFLEKVLNLE